MKRLIVLPGLIALFILSGCFDTVEEITVNDNGSGMYVSSMDMGKMLGMAKGMGGDSKEMKEMEDMKTDTLIYLKDLKDSLRNLSAAEKKIIEAGTLKVKINVEKEIFGFTFSFPFSKTNDIKDIISVLNKTKQQILNKSMKNKFGKDDDPDKEGMFDIGAKDGDSEQVGSEINEYYNKTYGSNKLTNKVNKEKIAKIEEDESLKTLKEMSQMGITLNMKTVINLPKPVKKAEGKGVKLSDDKKKVTIEGSLDDFFENASYFEYEIEY